MSPEPNQSDLEQDAINTYYAVRMGKDRAGRMEKEGPIYKYYVRF